MCTAQNFLSIFIVLIITISLSRCNAIFFFPDKKEYNTPDKIGLYYENVHLTNVDSQILHSWFIPAQSIQKNLPNRIAPARDIKGTIIQFHGNAENISTHFISLAWLTLHGYNVFTFDYRGYGRSQGNILPKRVSLDGLAALDYIARLPQSKTGKKIIVYGQSLGGILALEAMLHKQNRSIPNSTNKSMAIDLFVLDSTFASYKKIAYTKSRQSCLLWPALPFVPLLISDSHAPRNQLSQIHARQFLVIHSEKDPVVPYSMGLDIYQKLPEPKQLWTLHDKGHIGIFFQSEKDHYRKKFLSLLSTL